MSLEVLEEYFVTVTRKLGVDPSTARRKVELLAEFDVVVPEVPDILAAIDLHRLHGFSFGDAMVLRAAKQAGCGVVFSEDMQSSSGDRWGANFESVPVGFSLRVTPYSRLFAHARHLHPVRASRVSSNAPV